MMTNSFATLRKLLKNSNKFPPETKRIISMWTFAAVFHASLKILHVTRALPCHSSAQQRTVHISTFLIIDVSLFSIHGLPWHWMENFGEPKTNSEDAQHARMVKYPVIIASAQNFHRTTNNFRKCLVEHTNTMDFSSPISSDSRASETFIIFIFVLAVREKWVRMVNWWHGNERI